jgi:hypothetical protein
MQDRMQRHTPIRQRNHNRLGIFIQDGRDMAKLSLISSIIREDNTVFAPGEDMPLRGIRE